MRGNVWNKRARTPRFDPPKFRSSANSREHTSGFSLGRLTLPQANGPKPLHPNTTNSPSKASPPTHLPHLTMATYHLFTFSIETPDGPLPAYPFTGPEPPHTKTIYIETPDPSRPQSFQIRITPTHPLDFTNTLGFRFRITVEGFENAWWKTIAQQRSTQDGIAFEGLAVATPDGTQASYKQMLFQPLRMVEDDEVDEGMDYAELGCIAVEFAEIKALVPYDGMLVQNSGALLEGQAYIRWLTAGRIGETLTKPKQTGYTVFAKGQQFTLRVLYRSTAALQSLGVIPQLVLKQELGLQPIKQEEGVRVKRERDISAVDRQDDGRVKKEARRVVVDLTGETAGGRVRRSDGWLVDLTGVDDAKTLMGQRPRRLGAVKKETGDDVVDL
ncbi:hypothetical protein BJ508DRAFT_305715 [Ascobolus immersus RN42]|uniref:DUF7918 domain-containing protein n=1 Tax=Ascobolus immersus RN42 TaxID=1160509 RepID=A0A3N4IA21_ASCIM|nr:hypothetical protein BJ508DRAFT_305715 [Ascobolus immersus RN42]